MKPSNSFKKLFTNGLGSRLTIVFCLGVGATTLDESFDSTLGWDRGAMSMLNMTSPATINIPNTNVIFILRRAKKLNQSFVCKTKILMMRNNDVVKNCDLQNFPGFFQFLGEVDVAVA